MYKKIILVDAVGTFVILEKGVFKVFKAMQGLLDFYPNLKIILTNTDDEKMKVFGLDRMPYEVFTLKCHPEKTDSQYFRLMLEHFGYKPEEFIYFEHNPEAVASAQSVGIVSYHYDETKKDLRALQEFLQNNL